MSRPIADVDGNILTGNDGFHVLRHAVPGVSWNNKYGHNAACAAGDAVWSPGTAIPVPVAAAVCNVVSTSTEDDPDEATPPGTGAWTVLITGIDDNYDEVTELVTLNGTTDVPTTTLFWWINRMRVQTGNSFAGNAGTITLTSTATGTPLLGQIEINENTTSTAQYMVPRNHTAYIRVPQLTLQNTGNNTLMDLQLYRRHWADRSNGVDVLLFDTLLQAGANSDFQQKDWTAPLEFPAKTIIYWKVKSVAGGGTFNLIVDYDIWLVSDIAHPQGGYIDPQGPVS